MANEEAKKEVEKKGEAKEEPKGKKGKKKEEDEISEEDAALIATMLMLVTRSADVEKGIRMNALTAMSKEIREATSSMTSVPKPLKFLRPHYGTLKEHHAKETDAEVRARLRGAAPRAVFRRVEPAAGRLRDRRLRLLARACGWRRVPGPRRTRGRLPTPLHHPPLPFPAPAGEEAVCGRALCACDDHVGGRRQARVTRVQADWLGWRCWRVGARVRAPPGGRGRRGVQRAAGGGGRGG